MAPRPFQLFRPLYLESSSTPLYLSHLKQNASRNLVSSTYKTYPPKNSHCLLALMETTSAPCWLPAVASLLAFLMLPCSPVLCSPCRSRRGPSRPPEHVTLLETLQWLPFHSNEKPKPSPWSTSPAGSASPRYLSDLQPFPGQKKNRAWHILRTQ